MSQQAMDAVVETVRSLEELLAGCNHQVSIFVTGTVEFGTAPREPVALANGIYRAAKIRLRARVTKPVEHPWRRLHELVDAWLPTTASWSAREPPEVELSPEQIDRVTALTDDLADALEAQIGVVRHAYELGSHDGSYRAYRSSVCCEYDIAWNDLLLLADNQGALLHIGLSD